MRNIMYHYTVCSITISKNIPWHKFYKLPPELWQNIWKIPRIWGDDTSSESRLW